MDVITQYMKNEEQDNIDSTIKSNKKMSDFAYREHITSCMNAAGNAHCTTREQLSALKSVLGEELFFEWLFISNFISQEEYAARRVATRYSDNLQFLQDLNII